MRTIINITARYLLLAAIMLPLISIGQNKTEDETFGYGNQASGDPIVKTVLVYLKLLKRTHPLNTLVKKFGLVQDLRNNIKVSNMKILCQQSKLRMQVGYLNCNLD